MSGTEVVNGQGTDAGHPQWCSPRECFYSVGTLVHQQSLTRWEAGELAVESRLVGPVDDPTVYLELSLQDLKLKWFHYWGCLPIEVARRLRDQLSAHLDAVEAGSVLAPAGGIPVSGRRGGGRVFHLISSHEVVPNGHLTPDYFAVCGALVETASLEGADCPNECECEFPATMAYCPACLRAALGQNRRAGVENEFPS